MIYLIGGSGAPNFGDDLILSLWIRFYRDSGYAGPILVDCKALPASLKLHGHHEKVYFSPFIKNLARGRGASFEDYFRSGREFIRNPGPPPMTTRDCIGSAIDDRLRFGDVSLIHLYGGGYISGVWENSATLVGAASELRRIYRVPCVATGLGVTPFGKLSELEKKLWVEAIEDFDLFEVRDFESFNDISSWAGFRKNVVHGLDDNFLYPIDALTEEAQETEEAQLHFSGFSQSFDAFSDDDLMKKLEPYVEKASKVLFWTCNRKDLDFRNRLRKLIPSLVDVGNQRMINEKLPLTRSDFMITSRFHPHMMAARMGIGGCYIAHSNFYENKHKSVLDLGSSFKSFDASDAADWNSSRGYLGLRDAELVRAKRVIGDYVASKAKLKQSSL